MSREQGARLPPFCVVAGMRVVHNSPKTGLKVYLEARDDRSQEFVRILGITDDDIRLSLPFDQLDKLADMIAGFYEQGALVIKIDDLDLLAFRVDVSVDFVVPLVHDPLEVDKRGRCRVYAGKKAGALIGQVEYLGVDLRSDKDLELTFVGL